MFQSNVFFLSYWINLSSTALSGAWLGVQDLLGIYEAPAAAPVPFDGIGGIWEGPYPTPIVGVGAANLPDGKLMIWSAYARDQFSQPDIGDMGRTRTAVVDLVTRTSTEELVVNNQHDMFCPGQSTKRQCSRGLCSYFQLELPFYRHCLSS